MAGRSLWGLTPRQSIEGECLRRGTPEVVAGCLALIRAEPADDALVLALGPPLPGPSGGGAAGCRRRPLSWAPWTRRLPGR
jgi:hypothetical protein